MKLVSKNVPTEADEQKALVEWLEIKGYKFTAIPNSTYTTSWNQKTHNKQMGLRPGLPDLLILLPNMLLFCELKRVKGGRVSPAQAEWIKAINDLKSPQVCAIVAWGADQAIKIIETLSKKI